jgi:DNA-binding CsgD family transcriptional regulator
MATMKVSTDSTLCISAEKIALLEEADRRLLLLEPQNVYQLYEFLHDTARQIAPADSFYICLYSERYQSLFFAYNVDGDAYGAPVTVPLGNGPTSWVVRQRRSFVLQESNVAVQNGGFNFGDTDQPSLSAIHVPIRDNRAGRASPKQVKRKVKIEAPVMGVLSAQSYQPSAYDEEAIRALQWLAERAGVALRREQDEAAWRYRLRSTEASPAADGDDGCSRLVTMSDEVVAILQKMSQRMETLYSLILSTDAALLKEIQDLRRACDQAQTQVNLLPLRPDLAPPESMNLTQLTPTEHTVLAALATGDTLREVAAKLGCSVNTTKFHWSNVRQKLGVSNRVEAALLFTAKVSSQR